MGATARQKRFEVVLGGHPDLNGEGQSHQLQQAISELSSAKMVLDAITEMMTPEERRAISIDAASARCVNVWQFTSAEMSQRSIGQYDQLIEKCLGVAVADGGRCDVCRVWVIAIASVDG